MTTLSWVRLTPKDGSWANGTVETKHSLELTREILDNLKQELMAQTRIFMRHTDSTLEEAEENFLNYNETWDPEHREEIRTHWFEQVKPLLVQEREELKRLLIESGQEKNEHSRRSPAFDSGESPEGLHAGCGGP